MASGNDSDIVDDGNASGSMSGGFFVAAFVLATLLFSPVQPANSASSYVVTETVETLEYDIFEPAAPTESVQSSFGQYGPFRVITPDVAVMTGTVDSYTPAIFRQMQMRDCDGSVDEEANLALARMIRHAGISTHVPARGSVRSGAVELFLAGVRRTAHPDAEFIVHSWMDEDGREASDYPDSDPVHAEYLDYYQEMGVSAPTAKAFYALTNSVPFSGQLRLSRNDMARFQLVH